MKLSNIQSFKVDTQIQGFFQVREKHRRVTRTERPFLQLVLQDRSGSIEAKIWEDVPAFEKTFEQGDAVVVRGRVTTFRDKLQLEIEDIGIATPEKHAAYGFDPLDLYPATKADIEEMWTEITAQIRSMKNRFLRQLCGRLYKAHADTIKTHPASMVLHHAVYGGFLEHVHSMAQLVPELSAHYQLDRELLLTGVLLHDIGKVRELRGIQQPGYTDEGELVGHIVIGHRLVVECMSGINKFPKDLAMKVEHLILSHQGRLEWASPRQPKFPEALLLHYLDEMDAKLQMMGEILEKDPEEGSWTNHYNHFRRSLLKGPLNTNPHDPD